MKRIPILILSLILLAASAVQAADFQWLVNCQFRDDGQRLNFWVGYTSSSDLPDSYLAYIGNGPGIYMDTPLAGQHDRQIDVLLPDDSDSVTLFLYPENISIALTNSTEAADCGTDDAPVPITLDDQGAVNNPLVNERANTCYGLGQTCTTEGQWTAGWYLIRQQYGMS